MAICNNLLCAACQALWEKRPIGYSPSSVGYGGETKMNWDFILTRSTTSYMVILLVIREVADPCSAMPAAFLSELYDADYVSDAIFPL